MTYREMAEKIIREAVPLISQPNLEYMIDCDCVRNFFKNAHGLCKNKLYGEHRCDVCWEQKYEGE